MVMVKPLRRGPDRSAALSGQAASHTAITPSSTSTPETFPKLNPNPRATISSPLPGQIYVVDDFLSPKSAREVLSWAKGLTLDGPKRAGKGEAERTGNRTALQSSHITSILLPLLTPYLPQLRPAYTSSQPMLSNNIRVYHYPPQTFFGDHYDMPQLDVEKRRLSCWTVLIYLSEGVEGGGTTFHLDPGVSASANSGSGSSKGKAAKEKGSNKKEKGSRPRSTEEQTITIEPKAGRVLLHWHGMTEGGCMRHRGDVVVKGDKWVLRTDILA